jgi:hypothetical protein
MPFPTVRSWRERAEQQLGHRRPIGGDLAEAMSCRADRVRRRQPRQADIYDGVAYAVRHGFDEALEEL